ncbi:MAG: hypothetical protein R3C61_03805 [Bacteroidia bacterium]
MIPGQPAHVLVFGYEPGMATLRHIQSSFSTTMDNYLTITYRLRARRIEASLFEFAVVDKQIFTTT